jgi:CPA2 family monovalent cation:H+ antiporter-2
MAIEVFLAQAVAILAAAVAVTLVSHRFRVPTVVGFLATGLLIGPSGLRLVGDPHEVELFAEIGVVFLLFAIGLEFSLERLREIRRFFFLGGATQSAAAIVGFALVGRGFGLGWAESLFLGFLACLSSTAIVLKLLADRRELETPQGKVAIGILLFQDFLIVPLILLTPVLAGRAEASALEVAGRFALGLAIVAVVFVIARYLMPRLLWLIVRTRLREILVLGALLACLGMALFTESLGFSLALGAFLAGIVISESEYSHQIVAEIVPFRDVFNSVFFLSIGMLLDVRWALDHLPEVLLFALAILLGKLLTTGAAVALLGFPSRIVVMVGLALAQVGEFSFVLLGLGRVLGLIDEPFYQRFLAASVLTMAATPLLVAGMPWIRAGRPRRLAALAPGEGAGGVSSRSPGGPAAPRRHVVVVGFGMAGRTLARVLREAGVPYVVIELAADTVRRARQAGEPIHYGDVTRREILEHAGVASASTIVFMISDLAAVRRAVPLARSLAPELHILVRTRHLADVEPLLAAGASAVVAEELETSIEIFTRVLHHLHVPGNVIRAETRLLRGENYRMLRGTSGRPVPEVVLDILAEGTTEIYRIEAGSPADGQALGALDLRRASGATVIAAVRDGRSFTNPGADFALRAGDSLVLVGSHQEIDRAFAMLEPARSEPAPTGSLQPLEPGQA